MASGSALSRRSPIPPPRPIAQRVGVALGGIGVGVAVERAARSLFQSRVQSPSRRASHSAAAGEASVSRPASASSIPR
jgi:hypothetical protein